MCFIKNFFVFLKHHNSRSKCGKWIGIVFGGHFGNCRLPCESSSIYACFLIRRKIFSCIIAQFNIMTEIKARL